MARIISTAGLDRSLLSEPNPESAVSWPPAEIPIPYRERRIRVKSKKAVLVSNALLENFVPKPLTGGIPILKGKNLW